MKSPERLNKIADPAQAMRAFAEFAPVGVQIFDSKGECIYANERFQRIFGTPPAPGYRILEDEAIRRGGILPLIQDAFRGKVSKLPVTWYDLEHTKKFGKKCAIETHMVPVMNGAEVTNVIFIYKDVTAELYMQKERDDANALVQSVLNETKAVIYIKDLDGRYKFVNGQFCRIFDKQAHEIIGRTDHDLFTKETADGFRNNDLHIQKTRVHNEIEEVAVHSDGIPHTYLSLKFPLEDSAGNLLGVCGISTDFTQHRKLERELAAAKRMETVGLLASGVAHDFNNTIEIILLAADTLLMSGGNLNPEWKALIEAMQRSARNAAGMTRQLLTLGKYQPMRPQRIDLADLIARSRGILGSALGQNIRLECDGAEDLWPVIADPSQIEQILTNLFFNARDAMPEGGRLQVRLRNVKTDGRQDWQIGKPVGDFVELTVEDSGLGMSPETMDRIFEPFFTTKKEGQGTGLGLATVYSIVRNSGGDILVSSRLNHGTIFRILLRRATGGTEELVNIAPKGQNTTTGTHR